MHVFTFGKMRVSSLTTQSSMSTDGSVDGSMEKKKRTVDSDDVCGSAT
jgi:hypothetical protein